jgi:hypothetical protein
VEKNKPVMTTTTNTMKVKELEQKSLQKFNRINITKKTDSLIETLTLQLYFMQGRSISY